MTFISAKVLRRRIMDTEPTTLYVFAPTRYEKYTFTQAQWDAREEIPTVLIRSAASMLYGTYEPRNHNVFREKDVIHATITKIKPDLGVLLLQPSDLPTITTETVFEFRLVPYGWMIRFTESHVNIGCKTIPWEHFERVARFYIQTNYFDTDFKNSMYDRVDVILELYDYILLKLLAATS